MLAEESDTCAGELEEYFSVMSGKADVVFEKSTATSADLVSNPLDNEDNETKDEPLVPNGCIVISEISGAVSFAEILVLEVSKGITGGKDARCELGLLKVVCIPRGTMGICM